MSPLLLQDQFRLGLGDAVKVEPVLSLGPAPRGAMLFELLEDVDEATAKPDLVLLSL
jgi:hypothetical protein